MRISVAETTTADTGEAVREICEKLRNGTDLLAPDLVVFYFTQQYAEANLLTELEACFPGVPLMGGSSCLGVMTGSGFCSEDGRGLGLFALSDPRGSYGVGAASLGDDPVGAAAAAVTEALNDADRPGEIPALVWLIGTPGNEERVLEGIAGVLGKDVPVAGGSAADNAVAGHWQQVAKGRMFTDAVVVAVMFPSTEVSFAFHSGYSPTKTRGRVTRAVGRTILEIDHQPAARVYNHWTEGSIEHALDSGGKILGDTTLFPIGREVGHVDRLPYYRLSHPETVTADNGLSLFSEIHEGDEVILMSGSRATLVSRAGRVAEAAVKSSDMDVREVAGALVIYCAGCMLTVKDDMDLVAAGLSDALRGTPLLGTFTFGEQGCFQEGENYHGNLMISVVVFGKH